MSNKKFYSPIKSLVNLILTGEKKINNNKTLITVCQEFLDSASFNNSDDYNLYYLNCIEVFLNNCNNEERVNLVKVFYENDDLVTGVLLINTLVTNSKSIKQTDFSDTINSMLANFVANGEVDDILSLSLYFYIERVSKLTIINGELSRSDYEQTIKFHSMKRDLNDLLNF